MNECREPQSIPNSSKETYLLDTGDMLRDHSHKCVLFEGTRYHFKSLENLYSSSVSAVTAMFFAVLLKHYFLLCLFNVCIF